MPMPACSGARAMGSSRSVELAVGRLGPGPDHQGLWWVGRRATRCGWKLQPCNYIVKTLRVDPDARTTRQLFNAAGPPMLPTRAPIAPADGVTNRKAGDAAAPTTRRGRAQRG